MTQSSEKELLPCPFCFSKDIDPEGVLATDEDGQHYSYPACNVCGASCENWNTRHRPENGEAVCKSIADDELENWAKTRADDAGKLARELVLYRRASMQKPLADAVADAIAWADGFCKEVGCLADMTHLKTLIQAAQSYQAADCGRTRERLYEIACDGINNELCSQNELACQAVDALIAAGVLGVKG